jgi:STE24 endopeptidase
VSASAILALFLSLLALEQAWGALLALLNLRRARAARIPQAFTGAVDPQARARSVSYTLAAGRLGIAASLASAAVLAAVVLSGLLGVLDRAAGAVPLPGGLRGILFLVMVFAVFRLTSLPFRLWGTFGVEARFGFNRTTPLLYLLDTLKGLAVSAFIGVPALLGLFWLIAAAGPLWWLWSFLAAGLLELLMGVAWPLLIAPLFNRFSPLPEGPLREAILGLAGRLGFRTSGIFVVDASRRSSHSNAYFTGIGRARRIVLFDTLVKGMGTPEILAVLAHEIGHQKKGHIRSGLAVSLAASLAGFFLLGLLLPWPPLYHAFGIGAPSPHALLALAAFCSGPFTFFLSPLASLWSRRHERQADLFAARATGSAEGLKAALLGLARENLSNLDPHPLYSFWHSSHPTTAERVAALDAWQAGRAGKEPGE